MLESCLVPLFDIDISASLSNIFNMFIKHLQLVLIIFRVRLEIKLIYLFLC